VSAATADAASAAVSSPRAARAPRSSQPAASDDLTAVENASLAMKGAVARGIHAIGPALGRFAEQARTMVAVLAQRRREGAAEASTGRRTTAPAPGGGLHATGRRVVRGDASVPDRDEVTPATRIPLTGRRAAVAGGVMIAAILGAFALKKAHHEPAAATPASAESAAVAVSALPPAPPAPQAAPPASAATTELASAAASPPSTEGDADDAERAHHKHIHVTPFANGPVHHGNVLHLKMDGPIEAIEGASQPTGFAVKIPGRKSLEAAAPLAARDTRIAAIKVSNGSAGAELMVTFKDGVPTYRVSARGDTLVIALAPPGPVEGTVAKKDEKGGQSPSHTRHARDKARGDESL
jgi:hypothetical protein